MTSLLLPRNANAPPASSPAIEPEDDALDYFSLNYQLQTSMPPTSSPVKGREEESPTTRVMNMSFENSLCITESPKSLDRPSLTRLKTSPESKWTSRQSSLSSSLTADSPNLILTPPCMASSSSETMSTLPSAVSMMRRSSNNAKDRLAMVSAELYNEVQDSRCLQAAARKRGTDSQEPVGNLRKRPSKALLRRDTEPIMPPMAREGLEGNLGFQDLFNSSGSPGLSRKRSTLFETFQAQSRKAMGDHPSGRVLTRCQTAAPDTLGSSGHFASRMAARAKASGSTVNIPSSLCLTEDINSLPTAARLGSKAKRAPLADFDFEPPKSAFPILVSEAMETEADTLRLSTNSTASQTSICDKNQGQSLRRYFSVAGEEQSRMCAVSTQTSPSKEFCSYVSPPEHQARDSSNPFDADFEASNRTQQIPSTPNASMPGHGANEQEGKLLPCHRVKEDGLMRITATTLAAFLRGDFPEIQGRVEKLNIIDCRNGYEYEGGHIQGAVNISESARLEELIFDKPIVPLPQPYTSNDESVYKRTVYVLHCEFSLKRGPTMAKFMRSRDRARNQYPSIHFPEVYVLEGGYFNFYRTAAQLCNPQAYRPMAEDDLDRLLARPTRLFKRAASWAAPGVVNAPKPGRSGLCHSINNENLSPNSFVFPSINEKGRPLCEEDLTGDHLEPDSPMRLLTVNKAEPKNTSMHLRPMRQPLGRVVSFSAALIGH